MPVIRIFWLTVILYITMASVGMAQTLLPSLDSEQTGFGIDVAVNAMGTYSLVGDFYGNDRKGRVYGYRWTGEAWVEDTVIQPTGLGNGASFGYKLALNAEGSLALVGAHDEDNQQGAVYVLVRAGNDWTVQHKLTVPSTWPRPKFGSNLSLSADGTVAAISSSEESGTLYIFRRTGNVWTEETRMTAPDPARHRFFGSSPALSADGTTVATFAQGSEYAFVFTRANGTWTEARLYPADDHNNAHNEFVGRAGVSADGRYIVVGSSGARNADNRLTGMAYLYERIGTTWVLKQKLPHEGEALGTLRGSGVAITPDGSTVLVGNTNDALGGSVTVYKRTEDTWIPYTQLGRPSDSPNETRNFVISLSASSNAQTILVGSSRGRRPGDTGAVYTFQTPSYRINAPSSADVWTREETQDIRWTPLLDRGAVRLTLLDEDGRFLTTLAASAPNTGRFAWTPAATIAPGRYAVRIADVFDPQRGETSGVFFLQPSTPENVSRLVDASAAASPGYGHSVAMSRDGAYLATVTPARRVDNTVSVPITHVFKREGGTWALQARLDEATAQPGVPIDYTGRVNDLAFDDTGHTLVVGTPGQGSVHVYRRQEDTWIYDGHFSGSPRVDFGRAVAVSGDGTFIFVGDAGRNRTGQVVVYRVPITLGASYRPYAVVSPNGLNVRSFGQSLAASTEGGVLLVGHGKSRVGAREGEGGAQVFVRSGANWIFQARLLGDDTESTTSADDEFGFAVALSSDGSRALVGAPNYSPPTYGQTSYTADPGGAYLFERTGAVWEQQARFIGPSTTVDRNFGYDVALNGAGTEALIGVRVGRNETFRMTGSAVRFSERNKVWMRHAPLYPPGPTEYVEFGANVALSDDATLMAVGAPQDNVVRAAAGAVYTFDHSRRPFTAVASPNAGTLLEIGTPYDLEWHSSGGVTLELVAARSSMPLTIPLGSFITGNTTLRWTPPSTVPPGSYFLQATSVIDPDVSDRSDEPFLLQPSRTEGITQLVSPATMPGDAQGAALALSGDNRLALVSAPMRRGSSGSVHIFERGLAGWTLQATLAPPRYSRRLSFGGAVALAADGSRAFVSAQVQNCGTSDDCGEVYVYERAGSTWTHTATLTTPGGIRPNPGGLLTTNPSGTRLLIGSPDEDQHRGAAYLYELRQNRWSLLQRFSIANLPAESWLGASGALSEDGLQVALGAYGEDDERGAVYVFEKARTTWAFKRRLSADGEAPGTQFGRAMVFSADGTDLIISGPGARHDDQVYGHVYQYTQTTSSAWQLRETLRAPSPTQRPSFGYALGYDAELGRLLVGSPEYTSDAGAAFGYQFFQNAWRLSRILTAPDASQAAHFGSALALGRDGMHVLIGAPNDPTYGTASGAAYSIALPELPVFAVTHPATDTIWPLAQDHLITWASGDNEGEVRLELLTLNGETERVLAAATEDDGAWLWRSSATARTGEFRIRVSSVSLPTAQATSTGIVRVTAAALSGPVELVHTPDREDQFGEHTALSADGQFAIVGAPNAWSTERGNGHARIYAQQGSRWALQATLSPDSRRRALFGAAVALDAEGETALVGAPALGGTSQSPGAVVVFSRTGSTWDETARIAPDDLPAGALFGTALALSADGQVAAIGAPEADDGWGVVYVYERSTNSWRLRAQLTGRRSTTSSRFGAHLAMDAKGTRLVVGAPNAHRAFTYVRDGQAWRFSTALFIPDGVAETQLGSQLTMSGNGDLILAQAHDVARPDEPVVHVFALDRQLSDWAYTASVTPPVNQDSPAFGASAQLDAEGHFAIVGAPHRDMPGQVHAYIREGAAWRWYTTFTAPQAATDDGFGQSVALDATGLRVLVGANQADHLLTNAGAAYLFPLPRLTITAPANAVTITPASTHSIAWYSTQTSAPLKLTLTNAEGQVVEVLANDLPPTGQSSWTVPDGLDMGAYRLRLAAADASTPYGQSTAPLFVEPASDVLVPNFISSESGFGHDLALSGDGEIALVGAPQANSGEGALFLLEKGHDGIWLRSSSLPPVPSSSGVEGLGTSIALSSDATTALATAAGTNTPTMVHLFGQRNGRWDLEASLSSPMHGGDGFGYVAVLSGDGAFAFIGAPEADRRGAVHVYTRTDQTWAHTATLTPDDRDIDARFGHALAATADGSALLIGAPMHDGRGRTYLFTRSGTQWSEDVQLTPGAAQRDRAFGAAVALTSRFALVGAPSATPNDTCGNVAAFTRSADNWALQDVLYPSFSEGCHTFGQTLQLDAGATRALVSAHSSTHGPGPASTAYLFVRETAGWLAETVIGAPSSNPSPLLGRSVRLAGDGQTILGSLLNAESASHGVITYRLSTLDRTSVETPLVAEADELDVIALYPNPATRTHAFATVELAVRRAQHLRLQLYDTLGRRVHTLFEGLVPNHHQSALRIPTTALAPGMYIIHARGQHGTATRSLIILP